MAVSWRQLHHRGYSEGIQVYFNVKYERSNNEKNIALLVALMLMPAAPALATNMMQADQEPIDTGLPAPDVLSCFSGVSMVWDQWH